MVLSEFMDDDRAAWEDTQRGLWGQRPRDWAELAEPQNLGLIHAALRGVEVGDTTTLLDVGCGSGLALEHAAALGARVAGIDLAPALLQIARERVPDTDLREGGLDTLPFDDETFDAVIAINAVQFAFDPTAALGEVARVLRGGGRLAIGQFAAPERCESTALHLAMEALTPPERREDHTPYALSAPGALEQALADAGLTVREDGELPGDWRYASEDEALRGLLCSGGGTRAIRLAGEAAVRETVSAALAPFRQPDAAIVMHNRFRLVIAERG
jgi:SAM-dependent methyltransferase